MFQSSKRFSYASLFIKKIKMKTKMTYVAVQAIILAILVAVPTVISDDATPIPADKGGINSWFQANIAKKGSMDPALDKAEAAPKTIKVMKDGSGDFKTISDAVKSIPTGNTGRVIVSIGPGDYNEKVKIERTQPFVSFVGSPSNMPKLVYAGTALQYGTVDSASFIVEGDYFTASNIIISNSAPEPDGVRKGAQALAVRISGDKAAFYGCKFLGFQDTICDDKGKHFFKDCYVEGTVDFIFGSGKSLYLNTELHVLPSKFGMTVITAQARQTASEDNGYSFVHCSITGNAKNTLLGRAWMTSPRVVFAFTNMGALVAPEGWSHYNHPERAKTAYFGEFKNTGPGGTATGRVPFTKQLSEAEVKPFISLAFIEGSKWILPPPKA